MWRHDRKHDRKIVATIAAVLLLAAQLLALAHFHRSDGSRSFVPQTQLIADSDLCGLCNLALHAPLGMVAAPTIDRPRSAILLAPTIPVAFFKSRPFTFFLTRAPPPRRSDV